MQRAGTRAAGMSRAPMEWDRWLCEAEHLWQVEATKELGRMLGD